MHIICYITIHILFYVLKLIELGCDTIRNGAIDLKNNESEIYELSLSVLLSNQYGTIEVN